MTVVRVLALGNEMASDDGAALLAAGRLVGTEGLDVRLAGRPGPGLLEWLDPEVPTVLVDVVRTGGAPGQIVTMPLAEVADASARLWPLSSHGFGPGETLRLAERLGRPVPPGYFVGVSGSRFEAGTMLTPEVEAALDELQSAVRAAAATLAAAHGAGGDRCTNMG